MMWKSSCVEDLSHLIHASSISMIRYINFSWLPTIYGNIYMEIVTTNANVFSANSNALVYGLLMIAIMQ